MSRLTLQNSPRVVLSDGRYVFPGHFVFSLDCMELQEQFHRPEISSLRGQGHLHFAKGASIRNF